MGEVLPSAGHEIIEDPDVMSAFHERIREVRPDEAGSSRDKDRFDAAHGTSPVRTAFPIKSL
jgi:hypothetical protein